MTQLSSNSISFSFRKPFLGVWVEGVMSMDGDRRGRVRGSGGQFHMMGNDDNIQKLGECRWMM